MPLCNQFIDDDHLIGKHSVGHLCLKKYTTGEDCEVDYGELGKFTTAEPWSHISVSTFPDLGRRPAVVPASPESIGTYFSLLNRNIDFKTPVIFSHKNVTKSIEGKKLQKIKSNLVLRYCVLQECKNFYLRPWLDIFIRQCQ